MKLAGKVALITGGTQGIGLGCARTFAKHGAAVVLASIDANGGPNVEEEFRAEGHKALFLLADVTQEAAVQGAIDNTIAHFGRLDCLVNNAGWHPPATGLAETRVEDFERLLRLNLTSTFMGCKYALPHLKLSRGSILIMSSEVALIGQAEASAYVASKAGQVGLAKALALELAPLGIRVNAVCPAGVMTPLMREWANTQYDPAGALATVDSWHPLGRMATIEEIGEVCAFLASEEASFITGQTICPDGGAVLGYRRS
jgi:NAD(P)-dependent dehydrogenase (short-subunit alcohol dehydrogenase family)